MNPTEQDENPPGTILESDDEIRKAQELLRSQQPESREKPARSFRPTVRPPVARLTVCDDGRTTGEIVRIRDEQFVMGRTEGDFRLPFDELLSSRHFAITRQLVKSRWRCVVTDLQSRNGVFFRVAKAPLAHNTEFLIGRGCYQFQLNQTTEPETAILHGTDRFAPRTQAMQSHQKPGVAMLTEIVKGGAGTRISLTNDRYSIGKSAGCDVVRADDPFSESEHATLTRSDKGTWLIQNNHSKNGVWVRLTQIGINMNQKCDFQAGEQRFRLVFGAAS